MLESVHFPEEVPKPRGSSRKYLMEIGITSKDEYTPLPFWPLMVAGLLSGVGSTVANLVVAAFSSAIFPVPDNFRPFAAIPILAASMGGSLGAAGIFSLIERSTDRPRYYFKAFVLAVLVLSFILPASLVEPATPTSRGVGWNIAAALMLMHSIVAFLSVRAVSHLKISG
jgi:hypothetical protein